MEQREQIIKTMTDCQKTFNALTHILALTNPEATAIFARVEGVLHDLIPESCDENELCAASLINLRLMIELGKRELKRLESL